MMWITFTDARTSQPRAITWHTGTRLSAAFDPYDVTAIQASGDEVRLVLAAFRNLPYHMGEVQTWYGDTAKQIFQYIFDYGQGVR